jgi:ABC-type multidrug transport system permease subunit
MNDREHYPQPLQSTFHGSYQHAWLQTWFVALICLFAVGVVALYELH